MGRPPLATIAAQRAANRPPGGIPSGQPEGHTLADAVIYDGRLSKYDHDGTLTSVNAERRITRIVTDELAAGEGAELGVELSRSYTLLRLEVRDATDTGAPAQDCPCRIRVYTRTERRTADASRPLTQDPSLDHGVVLEAIFGPPITELDLSPIASGFLADTDGSTVPIRIDNLDGVARAIAVTFTWQPQEA